MSAPSNQALVQAYSRFATGDYITIAASCLAIYEFLVTIGDEIKIVWKRPITVRAVLLGSVRWCMLLAAILNFQLTLSSPKCLLQDCAPPDILYWVLVLVQFLQAALFSALRVFAIWNRSYVWSLVVFVLSIVSFVTNLNDAAMTKYELVMYPLTGISCIEESQLSARAYDIRAFRVVYITRGSLILADAIVLVLTWIKTFGHWMNARRLNMRVSLATCLLRDGTIYFIVLLAINMTQLLTFNFSAEASLVGPLVTTLPPLLISRFMINLRAAGSPMSDHSVHISDQQQGQPTLQFGRSGDRLGNCGGTLQNGWNDELCEEESDAAGVEEEGRRETTAEA
ncbi:uncharacterized protein PHACADRAFT_201113 [Phanerochaete carnosa HHB-10118-sp]|uniref:DUF6533 domain-containing protein n=1 Tax=Phanerochaete carnosa (strain HHB-10118-sp) TaxID=650164 RepID=K5VGD2_PHACS|nr:uncharacterized protein PHACADRAFT_201113 [Phanerochaete carnosa HHB-10118-sp]EKM50273.1 hypothetical protein PHACADRAFT_201113 [Phanerochaete carnosa HHB-10118-sp]